MVEPVTMMLAASVVSGIGKIFGGVSANKAKKREAYRLETEKVLSKVRAAQRAQDRMDTYLQNTSSNIALMSSQYRDVQGSMSVKAFLEKQKEIAGEDTRRSDMQGYFEQARFQAQAQERRREGKAALVSGFVDGFTTIAGGYYRYDQARIPSG